MSRREKTWTVQGVRFWEGDPLEIGSPGVKWVNRPRRWQGPQEPEPWMYVIRDTERRMREQGLDPWRRYERLSS